MASASNNSTNLEDTGKLWLARIRHIVLSGFTGTPAGNVKKAVINAQIDIGHQRWNGFKGLEYLGELFFVGRLCGNFDNLLDLPFTVRPVPEPNGRRQISETDNTVYKALGFSRVMSWS